MDAVFAHIRTGETNCSNWVADCILVRRITTLNA